MSNIFELVSRVRKSLASTTLAAETFDVTPFAGSDLALVELRGSFSRAKAENLADELETELLFQDVRCTVKHCKVPGRKTRWTVIAEVEAA